MNRVIKFRAWDEEAKTMYSNGDVVFYLGRCWLENASLDPESIHIKSKVNLISMQFTGLKDKNGVDIYERCEIDNRFYVDHTGCDYVLVDISNGDMIRLSDYFKGSNGNVEITRDYREV